MITLFVYPADEDWGQHELIDATLKGAYYSYPIHLRTNTLQFGLAVPQETLQLSTSQV